MEKTTLEQLNLLDNFLFGTTLGHEEYGIKVSGIILKTILGREVKIRKVASEKVILPAEPGLHGVRLDAFIEEEGTEVAPGSLFDLEPDRKEGEKYDLPKRVRYYHSKIAVHHLPSSVKYRQLPQVWVIFITSFDPLGHGRLVYTIKNHCVELPDMDYDDGATTLLLYVDGDPEGYPRELVQLLAYMKSSIPENASNPDLEQIHSCVDKVKKDPKVQEVFMTLEEYVEQRNEDVRKRAEAAENRAEAERDRADAAEIRADEEKNRANAAENRADAERDRADAAERLLGAAIRRHMNASNSSFEEAASILGIEADQRDYYRAMLREAET